MANLIFWILEHDQNIRIRLLCTKTCTCNQQKPKTKDTFNFDIVCWFGLPSIGSMKSAFGRRKIVFFCVRGAIRMRSTFTGRAYFYFLRSLMYESPSRPLQSMRVRDCNIFHIIFTAAQCDVCIPIRDNSAMMRPDV